jgi:hypothetical protein
MYVYELANLLGLVIGNRDQLANNSRESRSPFYGNFQLSADSERQLYRRGYKRKNGPRFGEARQRATWLATQVQQQPGRVMK